MNRNVEIKARIEDIEDLERRVSEIADAGPRELIQDDTFFLCDQGRLKLRVFADGVGELIFYQRPDISGPKESNYLISHTREPDKLREILQLAYGFKGRVQKQRMLYFIGRTRIHVDRVDDLGHFLELEVVLNDNESTETGVAEAHSILSKLGVHKGQLIEAAYVDLLASSENL